MYLLPMPVSSQNFRTQRKVTDTLTNIGTGKSARTVRPYQLSSKTSNNLSEEQCFWRASVRGHTPVPSACTTSKCGHTRTDTSNGCDHRYGVVCPVPSAHTAWTASSRSWADRGKLPNQPFFLSFSLSL
jgi:hypothetical protein